MKKVITIILTVLIFLSAATLGVATVFRVSEVTVDASMVSPIAKKEAEAFRRRLLETYVKESTLFLDDTAVKEIVKEFPYFRLVAVEKAMPNRLVVKVAEDAEVYAVANADGSAYYQLNADGDILGVRADYANRLDGNPNLLIKGLTLAAQEDNVLGGDDCYAPTLRVLQKANGLLGGIRRNITQAELLRRSPETILCLTTREGVLLYLLNPQTMTEEKAQKAIDKYLSLSDEQRLMGCVVAFEDESGIGCEYRKNIFE